VKWHEPFCVHPPAGVVEMLRRSRPLYAGAVANGCVGFDVSAGAGPREATVLAAAVAGAVGAIGGEAPAVTVGWPAVFVFRVPFNEAHMHSASYLKVPLNQAMISPTSAWWRWVA
jgi:hypothetical protein